ncbi:Zyxin [Caenorhabditis elegans]|uniref:Zyxin n=3 Tax=Caenorhabditis elegans TaxID=6239 RepID=ZYX_CAEEL|nr:Zyxin [Caenorhabditis elegans]Q9U3F4.1 RecName: Full=Zyxin [Caenorhabditis elegans]CAB03095.2 Zyxin [Caenorhabditis elegans]|eukprot:NP_496776.1 Zyxin [Caenorhabditis elegans]
MGPPPPPPPPPLLPSGEILPSRKWKTEDAPRRNNHPAPAPPKPSRPTVDASALQHAAARLRKTGYNEPVRGDVENLSDGRLDRPHQQLPDGDRTYRANLQQLAQPKTRAEIPSPPTYSNQPRPLGDFHRDPNALSQFQQSREALLSSTSPTSNYSPINKFSSSTLTQYANKSPSPPSFGNSNSEATYVSPYSSKHSYPTNFRSYHKDDDYFNNTATTATTTTSSNSLNENNNSNKYGNKETVLQWSEPYDPSKIRRSQSPIRNAREMIHEYSTTNYVTEVQQPPPPPPDLYQRMTQARTFLQNSLAKQLRDEGLTESQKAANRNQTGALSASSSIPFDASQIVKNSYNGDEVDHLVHQMRTKLNQPADTSPSIVQYPRRQAPDSSRANYSATTSTSFSSSTTRKIMNINICVGCGKEITGDQPGCNAMNQIFHVDCFKCGQCSKTLAGASFYNIDDKPTCEGCYQNSLEKCTACNRAISDKLLRACGGVYHVNCFVCFSCKKSLDGIPFTLDKDNNVHCVPCFHDKFAPRCALCSKPIVPQDGEKESVRVVAMDKSFHVDCYKCEDCGMQLSSKLEGQGCYPIDNHLLCKTCNGNRLRVVSST